MHIIALDIGTRLSMSARTVAGPSLDHIKVPFFCFLDCSTCDISVHFRYHVDNQPSEYFRVDWASVWSRALRAYFSDKIQHVLKR